MNKLIDKIEGVTEASKCGVSVADRTQAQELRYWRSVLPALLVLRDQFEIERAELERCFRRFVRRNPVEVKWTISPTI